jgi:hypothetical protein
MAETIKPKDLNPNFLKKIEDKYGPISPDDFFSADLDTYYKADKPEDRGEGGGITHTIINLPSFIELFKDLGQAKSTAKSLTRKKELRGDAEFQQQAKNIATTFNDFRTFFRNNYPDQYSIVKSTVKEVSTSGAAGGYLTKYAYRKKGSPASISQYTKIGYKPVDQKSLRKKSKGFDYVDLYKD